MLKLKARTYFCCNMILLLLPKLRVNAKKKYEKIKISSYITSLCKALILPWLLKSPFRGKYFRKNYYTKKIYPSIRTLKNKKKNPHETKNLYAFIIYNMTFNYTSPLKWLCHYITTFKRVYQMQFIQFTKKIHCKLLHAQWGSFHYVSYVVNWLHF